VNLRTRFNAWLLRLPAVSAAVDLHNAVLQDELVRVTAEMRRHEARADAALAELDVEADIRMRFEALVEDLGAGLITAETMLGLRPAWRHPAQGEES
jgi:hypothetical protein